MNIGEILTIEYLGSKVSDELKDLAFTVMLETNMNSIVDGVAQ